MKAPQSADPRQTEGFARQDLIIAVALVLLLASIQLPLLAGGRAADQAAACRNNLRQLINAWLMYAHDNQGKLTPNNGSGDTHPRGTWAAGWLDLTTSFDNLNTDYLTGYQKTGNYGHLGPYLFDASPFRCPTDTSQTRILGRTYNRVRSVAMNNWMGGDAYCGANSFREFRRESDIIGLAPSQAWVIQEEREDSINDAWFAVRMDTNPMEMLINFPSSNHQGGGHLTFADGHVEHHAWRDPRTNPELIKGQLLWLQVESPGNADLEWLRARTTALK